VSNQLTVEISRRSFLTAALLTGIGVSALRLPVFGSDVDDSRLKPAKVLMDMVQNTPGAAPFLTHFNSPGYLKSLGFEGKVYDLFLSAQFGIDWTSVDPNILPSGSPGRIWVDNKAAELDTLYNAAKAQGLKVLCHTDMIIFPKALISKYNLLNYTDITDPTTQQYVVAGLKEIFTRFPQVDGLVIRIGETYLNDAPYHSGGFTNHYNPQKGIIPLLQLLRQQVCERLPGKLIIFRTWDSFDMDAPSYLNVANAIEPHPNLIMSVKHCEGDFHRGDAFSRALGIGQHQQIIEVECQREYEGKGAYPNYIANGIIEGFEETPTQSVRKIWANPIIVGMFTWSRGGGWGGPVISNELWCDVNVYVLAKWAREPDRSEADILRQYCRNVLKLNDGDTTKFRTLCLLSAAAIYRGVRSTHNDISPMWTRDDSLSVPVLPTDPVALKRVLDEKAEAKQMWTQIASLAQEIDVPDPATKEYLVTTCKYGLILFCIINDIFQLTVLRNNGDPVAIKTLLVDYDFQWSAFKQLRATHPSCATLYTPEGHIFWPGVDDMVAKLRTQVQS
jgi:hypothetical protein